MLQGICYLLQIKVIILKHKIFSITLFTLTKPAHSEPKNESVRELKKNTFCILQKLAQFGEVLQWRPHFVTVCFNYLSLQSVDHFDYLSLQSVDLGRDFQYMREPLHYYPYP